MVMTLSRAGELVPTTQRNIIPKERYVSQEFFDLEMERLWPRVWQMACREEEVPHVGDFLEYVIGDQSILVTRSDPGTIRAFYNTCPHRGTRLAAGVGNFATGEIRCRYHGLALRARRHQQRGGRPLRLPRVDDRRRGLPGPDQGRPLGWLRLHQHGPGLRVARVVPRPAPGPARPLRLRKDALSLPSHRHPPGQLESPPSTPSTRGTTSKGPTPSSCAGPTTPPWPTAPWASTTTWARRARSGTRSAPAPVWASARATTTSASCWPS